MLNQYQNLIHQNAPSPLSTVAHHYDVACVERFFSDTFPMHLAIHKVTNAADIAQYTDPHSHDVPEINIIIADNEDGLEYEIQLEDETYCVTANSTVWIPAGMMHASNVIAGSGYFIAIRLNGYGDASKEMQMSEFLQIPMVNGVN